MSRRSEIVDNYHNVQQDVLESFVGRGPLRKLAEPASVFPSGKRIPGLKLDHPRQLAVRHSLVRFANIAAGLLAPFPSDRILAEEKRCQLDRLYQRIAEDLTALVHAAGLKIAAGSSVARTKFPLRAG